MQSARRISLVLIFFFQLARADDWTAPGVTLTAGDPGGLAFKPLERLEVGDSLAVGLAGAPPSAAVEFLLQDDRGREWSYSRLRSDARGEVPPTLFWYQSGVIGTTTRRTTFRPDPAFTTFDEAEAFFARSWLTLTVRDDRGTLLATRTFRPSARTSPFVYPSNALGVLENGISERDEDVYATGRKLPPGSAVQLFLVPNRFGWKVGDAIEAVASKTIQLAPGETSFTERLWDRGVSVKGSYDIITRLGDDRRAIIVAGDIISFGDDTGVVLYNVIEGHVLIEIAGRLRGYPLIFEFLDAFEKGDDVYGAVDPTDVPQDHQGGSYAQYWTVKDHPADYWKNDVDLPALKDAGDGPEIRRVKYFCINGTRAMIWDEASQKAPIAPYDVVVDFGSMPAHSHDEFVADDTYNAGTDFLDGMDTAGFWVFEDPGKKGPMAVGWADLLEPNGISGITDPSGDTGPPYPVNLAWAKIMYPAKEAGKQKPVIDGGKLPVALFLHGRNWSCDSDGPFSGKVGGFGPCLQGNRIPDHEGYNYIMERLASHGIFCISISAHEIQHDKLGEWNYKARGKLILKFLDKLRDWTDNGTDPFGLFEDRIDMTHVVLSGHSRGGEGVVAAQQLNGGWPQPHSILAVNAIAPTDQDVQGFNIPTVPYFLLLGARDGDVFDMQGLRTYDRVAGQPKAVAWVYGANHNYFNTIWTPAWDNPWAGSEDDCPQGLDPNNIFSCSAAMSDAAQRQIALTTISAFFRWHLQDLPAYREILTGKLKPQSMDNDNVFWTFRTADPKVIDDFEQDPHLEEKNSVDGDVTAAGFDSQEEKLLNLEKTNIDGFPPASDTKFLHDTVGLRIQWSSLSAQYTTEIPQAHRDVSAFTYLSLRAGIKVPEQFDFGTFGPDVVLKVNIEDGLGNVGKTFVKTKWFARIPHPFIGSRFPNRAVMSGVRIPLFYFTMDNAGVDLKNVAKIRIVPVSEEADIAIDDIEFTK